MKSEIIEIETHPWEPFMPDGARVLVMGTFPPQPKRWGMDFYYPNRTNDFWFIMGLLFFGDKDALYNRPEKEFRVEKIKNLLMEKGIALNDTARKVRRLKNNASDKFLEIVEPVPLDSLLAQLPECRNIATTGEKAAGVVAELTSTEIPKIGGFVTDDRGYKIWRMPSTSRAYPLALEKKAAYYAELFRSAGIL